MYHPVACNSSQHITKQHSMFLLQILKVAIKTKSIANMSSIIRRPTSILQDEKDESETDNETKKGESKKNNETQKGAKSQSALVMYMFENVKKKEKETYLETIRMYISRDIYRRGHVEFIYSAMKYMEEFGVHRDLEAYKKLIDVLPKGKFIPTNVFQVEFLHYPKQQQCAVDLLEQMEDNSVIPDREMETMLINIFGKSAIPLRKYWRMMYWMPRFKNLNPYKFSEEIFSNAIELAKQAIKKISEVDPEREIIVYETEKVPDSVDKTWIVSSISPTQKELLKKHPVNTAVYVEGPFKVWMRNVTVDYFILRADPVPKTDKPISEYDADDVTNIKIPFWEEPKVPGFLSSVHEQEDGTILAVCATGTSSKDSLLSWIRCLQDENPILSEIPVIFTLKVKTSDVNAIESGEKVQGRLEDSKNPTDKKTEL
ncbi:evolutionarily conserved signaling intermediate in Toll pathway, mitochondrial isoform X2 [Cephus cinctus]|uniref:Evolutionarily conserved signaling intermediate in Toll pathway, mitochondrial n=1 Tax=Cephus cinctus TaxID=211228 RepID=A0AAJ7BVM1_CEPCN|nr:evolutionarily conserved signaling intermediate in Toll pathway, mitochondrial isoform X2 [Cephus cinctus]